MRLPVAALLQYDRQPAGLLNCSAVLLLSRQKAATFSLRFIRWNLAMLQEALQLVCCVLLCCFSDGQLVLSGPRKFGRWLLLLQGTQHAFALREKETGRCLEKAGKERGGAC